MERITLKELSIPIIKSIDSFNYLLKTHHRRVAVMAYEIGKEMGLDQERLTDLVLAAAMHDIGALSIQERNTLVQADVLNPYPHCLMGYKMLQSFDAFEDVAMIIKHHHINYEDRDNYMDDIPIESYIVHFVDRIDIYISPDSFILDQKELITKRLEERVGTLFHPDVYKAFLKVSESDIFWININNVTMETVLNKIDFDMDFELPEEKIIEFAKVVSRIVDFRSRYTATHSFTVSNVAYHIGEFLGLEHDVNTKLLIAGLLHDIGKIGIDPSLIEKKGKLTDSEFDIVKLHSYYSGQILQELGQSAFFHDIVRWSERHHEKVDGTGYPHGIKGDELDMGIKILAFSDVIAALMENRPYRRSMGIDKTFRLIEMEIANKIDPDMFQQIKKDKSEINRIVLECQKEGQRVYSEQYSY